MSKKKNKKSRARTRDQPHNVGFMTSAGAYQILTDGYTRLSENPEVVMCVDIIADLISDMTIYQMENTPKGDKRVIDGLSRKLDIEPYKDMTQKAWMQHIVRSMLLEGDGNAIVIPTTKNGYIDQLRPIPGGSFSIIPNGNSYRVLVGPRYYEPDDILHFVLRPDPEEPYKGIGPRVALRDVVTNLKQAGQTKKEFMTDKWRPSVIVSVDGLTDDFTYDEGRKKIRDKYISETGDGYEPWVIPAELIKVEQVKPLSLSDLALNDAVQIDKRTVAGIFKVPAYFVGAGEFKQDQYNNFVQTTIFSIAKSIAQEFTRKLLVSPNRYFKFNSRALLTYDLDKLANVAINLRAGGLITGNEGRGWLDFTPKDGLDELQILENFIPLDKIGEQKKLGGEEDAEPSGANTGQLKNKRQRKRAGN